MERAQGELGTPPPVGTAGTGVAGPGPGRSAGPVACGDGVRWPPHRAPHPLPHGSPARLLAAQDNRIQKASMGKGGQSLHFFFFSLQISIPWI